MAKPARRPLLSLRAILVAAVVAGVCYAVLGAALVIRWVEPAADALERGSEPVQFMVRALNQRMRTLEAVVPAVRDFATSAASPHAFDGIRAQLQPDTIEATAIAYADLPGSVRVAVAQLDHQTVLLRQALLEVGALSELRRARAAQRLLLRADTLMAQLQAAARDVQAEGLTYLVTQEDALRQASLRASRAMRFWAVIGVVLLPLVLLGVQRRVVRPLFDLRAAIERLSAGDLNARAAQHYVDEIGVLADHFNRASEFLRQRTDEQGRLAAAGALLAGVAHEVKNPLMAIVATASERLATHPASDDADDVKRILQQARRAGHLVQGLLKFVRQADREGVAVASLAGVVREALSLVHYQLTVGEAELTLMYEDGGVQVSVPPSQLEQVVVNLLTNALEALGPVPPPRRLTVRTWRAGDQAHLAVEDNGPGVAAEVRAILFEPFTTSSTHGSGLGLYISRRIARRFGGDLVATHPDGGGARFELVVPITHAASQEQPDPMPVAPPAALPLAGVTVMLVEDEADVRRPLARFLTRRGAKVVEAQDGVEAMSQLATVTPGVILTDLRMPRMSGLELYTAVAERQPALADRFLFLSGDILQVVDAAMFKDQAARILVKPVELPDLERKILEVLQGVATS